MRKHVKTVHGAEFYANKKHKGGDSAGPGPSPGGGMMGGGSPRSDDGMHNKTASVSSPSIKSEEAGSPGQIGSPGTTESSSVMTPGMVSCAGDGFGPCDDLTSDGNVSTSNGAGDLLDQNQQDWAVAEEIDEFDIAELSASVSVALGGGGGGNGNDAGEDNAGRAAAFNLHDRNARNRIKGRLQAKQMPALLSLPGINSQPSRRGNGTSAGLTEINQRITDLRMGGGSTAQSPQQRQSNQGQTTILPTSHQQSQLQLQVDMRRDSNATTVSSYYGSMRSGASPLPFGSSRRSSDVSQISTVSNGRAAFLSSPYDPISPGSSRRSSETSMFNQAMPAQHLQQYAIQQHHQQQQQQMQQQQSNHQQVGVVTNGQPLTASMAAQLQKMQRRALIMQNMASTQNLVLQTQNMSLSQQNLAAAAAAAASAAAHPTSVWNAQHQNGQTMSSTAAYPRQSQTPGAVMPSYTQQPNQSQREVRRASDPVRPMAAQTAVPLPPLSSQAAALQRHHSFTNVQQPIGRTRNQQQSAVVAGGYPSCHPNEGIVLEEVGEGHMVEEKLVVPDEMLQYLNQVKKSRKNLVNFLLILLI